MLNYVKEVSCGGISFFENMAMVVIRVSLGTDKSFVFNVDEEKNRLD
jgi:hypothetical protein